MRSVITKHFCDACGKNITDEYCGRIEFNDLDPEFGYDQYVYDFCADCMKSFNKWKATRKEKDQKTSERNGGENLGSDL